MYSAIGQRAVMLHRPRIILESHTRLQSSAAFAHRQACGVNAKAQSSPLGNRLRPDQRMLSLVLARYLDQQTVDTLEAARQLVATPATLAFVVLQIIGFERQRTLARLQHQGRTDRQHGQIGQVLFA